MKRVWMIPVAVVLTAVLSGGVVYAASAQQDKGQDVGRAEGAAAVIGPRVSEMRTVNIEPCRIVDTRKGAGDRLAPNAVRSWDARGALSGQGGSSNCKIPASAEAIEANITAVDPGGSGWVRAKAYDGSASIPAGTILNYWLVGVTNGTSVPLCTGSCSKDLTVGNYGNSTDIVIDVTAYSVPPMYIVFDGDANETAPSNVTLSAKRMEFVSDLGTGIYRVRSTDGTDVRGCAVNVTAGASDLANAAFTGVSADVVVRDTDLIDVFVADANGTSIDDDIMITVHC